MKKAISVILSVMIIVIAFAGCSSTGGKLEIPATYQQVGLGLNVKYRLNENSTFEEENSKSKGTFESSSNSFSLKHKTNRILRPELTYTYKYVDGLCCQIDNSFSEDNEYGTALSLNEEGRTDQDFKSVIYFTDNENKKFSWSINFELDGTVSCKQFTEEYTKINGTQMLTPNKTLQDINGTYSVENNVITITCEDGSTKKLVIIKDKICWDVLEKTE